MEVRAPVGVVVAAREELVAVASLAASRAQVSVPREPWVVPK